MNSSPHNDIDENPTYMSQAEEYVGWFLGLLQQKTSIMLSSVMQNSGEVQTIVLVGENQQVQSVADIAVNFHRERQYGNACLQYLFALNKQLDERLLKNTVTCFKYALEQYTDAHALVIRENQAKVHLEVLYTKIYKFINDAQNAEFIADNPDIEYLAMENLLRAALLIHKLSGQYIEDHLQKFTVYMQEQDEEANPFFKEGYVTLYDELVESINEQKNIKKSKSWFGL